MTESRISAAAIASLVLAFVALLTSFLAVGIVVGAVAIVCGHVARAEIRRRTPRLRGAELALGGLAVGYVSVILGALIAWFILRPAFTRWWTEPTRVEVRRTLDETRGKDASAVRATVVRLLGEGKQAAAEEVLDAELRRHGSDQQLLFARAVLYRSRWEVADSLRFMKRVRDLNPTTLEARCAELSISLDRNTPTAEAMDRLAALADANGDNPFVLWLLAVHCRDYFKETSSKRYSQLADDTYRKLLKHFPVAPVLVHQTYANILDELDRHEDALLHRREAVKQEPRAWTYEGLANTLSDLHRYAEADIAYRTCVGYRPGDADYWREWGNCRSAAGFYTDAAGKFRQAAALEPDDPGILNDWAWSLEKQGKYAEALTLYRKALPYQGGLACNRIGCLYFDGHGVPRDYAKARYYYELGASRSDAVALQNLASMYQDGTGVEEDDAKAVELYKQALGWRHGDDTTREILLAIGHCYQYSTNGFRDYVKAADYLRQAADLGDVRAANEMAWLFATTSEPTGVDGRDVVERAEKLPRGEGDYVDTLAAVYARVGDFAKAVEAQRLAVAVMQRKGCSKSKLQAAQQRLELYQAGKPYAE